jgi:hypothetical protein
MNRTLRAGLVPATLGLLAGCIHVGPDQNNTTLDFDFTIPQVAADWIVGAADYPVGNEADVADSGGVRTLPSPLATTQALYVSGTNATGDLFVFLKKRFQLVDTLTPYKVAVSITYASDVHSGCNPPVWIKAGASGIEPVVQPDASNIYRLSVNKGSGMAPGDFTQLGDIGNGLAGCPSPGTFALRTTTRQTQVLNLISDEAGGFWLFIGMQSSANGERHEIYITDLRLTFFAN